MTLNTLHKEATSRKRGYTPREGEYFVQVIKQPLNVTPTKKLVADRGEEVFFGAVRREQTFFGEGHANDIINATPVDIFCYVLKSTYHSALKYRLGAFKQMGG